MRLNPLLAKETRLQMRTWRTFAMLALYLLVLGGFGTLFFASFSHGLYMGYTDAAQLGQNMFSFLGIIQFVLIVFFVPALTAGAISGERERQTFDLLVCTRLTSAGIVLGKLAASLSTVFLLILASLPLYGFVFLLGGVSPGELAILFVILMVSALCLGCLTIFFSALFRKTVVSFIASYSLVLFVMGGTFLIAVFGMSFGVRMNTASPVSFLLTLNPLVLFEWLYPEPVGQLLQELSRRSYPFTAPWQWLKFWHLHLVLSTLLSVAGLFFAARMVNPLAGSGKKGSGDRR